MADPLDILTGTIRPSRDDAWTTLAGLAQAVASIPEHRARAAAQRAEMEAQQMNAQIRAGELQFRQQALQQQEATKAKVAQMDQAVNAIVSGAMVEGPDGVKRFDRKRIMEGFARVGAPLDVQAHTLKALDDVEDSGSKLEEARREHAARVLNAVLEAPDTEQAAMMGIAEGKANGWLKDSEAQPLMALLASGQDPKPRFKQLRDTLSDKYRAKQEVKDIGPGHQLRDETGALIAENPLQEKPVPEITPYQAEQLKLQRQRLGMEQARAGQEGATPNLSAEGLDAVALSFAKTGQLPPLGMGKQATALRAAIINRAATMNPALDLASNRADFQANEGALKQLQKQRDAIGAFEQTAQKNIDTFLKTAEKVVDTGSPLANKIARHVSGDMLGSPDVQAYNAARQVAINEVAKITSNPTLVGQLSDTARKEVESFNPAGATLKQSVAVMKLLKQDMQNRTDALDAQIGAIRSRIKGGKSEPAAEPKRIKVTFDKDGNLVRQ